MSYVINSDHLELVLKTSEPLELFNKNGFNISTSYKPSNNTGFTKCNEIHYENQTFGLLYSEPTPKLQFKDRNAMVLELSNESLYRQKTISEELPNFFSTYNLAPASVRELHLALDGPGIIERHESLYRKESLIRKRAVKTSIFKDDNTKQITGITLGSRKSNKYVAIYNKSRELLISEKKYIMEYWENNGLSFGEIPMDRLELRLRTKELLGLEKNIHLLNNPNFLASLLISRTKNHLTFINRKNKKEHSVIDWSSFKLQEIKKEKRILFSKPTQRIKTTLKTYYLESNFKEGLFESDFKDFLLEKYQLNSWYLKSQHRWKKENPIFISNLI